MISCKYRLSKISYIKRLYFSSLDSKSQSIEEKLKHKLSYTESWNNDFDYQTALNLVFSKTLNPTQSPKVDTSEEDKLKDIPFFNSAVFKILESTNNDILLDIATKQFVGSTDIPKSIPISLEILAYALHRNKFVTKEEKADFEFFYDYFSHSRADLSQEERRNVEARIYNKDAFYKAKYIFARDLFKLIAYGEKGKDHKFTNDNIKTLYKEITKILNSVKDLIYEAHYILGYMRLNSLFYKRNIEWAYYHFSIGASFMHASCFYEIYKM